jgi:hypothetical protein
MMKDEGMKNDLTGRGRWSPALAVLLVALATSATAAQGDLEVAAAGGRRRDP